MTTQMIEWVFGKFWKDIQIWGCERASARSHPQIWGTTPGIPEEPIKSLGVPLVGWVSFVKELLNVPNDKRIEGFSS